MPKRSNLFQEVVASVHRHMAMAGNAVVEESALLPHRLTGELREVDVVIRSTIAGQEVVIAIEATANGRPATQQWVEQQAAKHQELGTSKLVLVARGGFSRTARTLAEKYGAATIAPEDLEGGDPAFEIVNNLNTLWAKVYSANVTNVAVRVEHPDLGQVVELVDPPGNLDICRADGSVLFPLSQVVSMGLADHVASYSKGDAMRDQETNARHRFSCTAPAGMFRIGGEEVDIFVRWMESDGSSVLHKILAVDLQGEGSIEIQELPMRHTQLGPVVGRHAG
jgi:hypothetical protein